ncbi:hypothetical protein ACTAZI_09710 [Legionella bozemanae]|uniref:hypothetical protein n=1 Tax=Legionella bozemanae TaxID=447 RepID=UPI00399D02D0
MTFFLVFIVRICAGVSGFPPFFKRNGCASEKEGVAKAGCVLTIMGFASISAGGMPE